MATITVWLLVGIGNAYMHTASPTLTVERFPSAAECQRVAHVIETSNSDMKPALRCIQATVAR